MKVTLNAAVLLLLLSCGRTTLPCEATTCSGCCDGWGNCQPGGDDLECGTGAKACVICARGATCRGGLCLGGTAAGAAGGGTGGGNRAGGSAGGGSVGGGTAGGPASIGARTFVPDALLVVDRSGSMNQPLTPNDPACGGCTNNCPPTCRTRGRALQTAAGLFLMNSGTDARLGLVLYPSNSTCGPPSAVSQPLPASDDLSELSMFASAVSTQLSAATFVGGTPTGPAIAFAASQPALTTDARREHFLVLVSDGLPNCNERNAATCMNPMACQCTIGNGCTGQFCTLGCLDRQGTLDAVGGALGRSVKTLVIGFGPEVVGSSPALALFDDVGRAGGAPLSCTQASGNECEAGSPCLPDGTCRRKFSTELNAGFARVGNVLRRSGRCRWVLDAPVAMDPRLEVQVNGLMIMRGAGGFVAEGADVVRIEGAVCSQLVAQPAAVTFTLAP